MMIPSGRNSTSSPYGASNLPTDEGSNSPTNGASNSPTNGTSTLTDGTPNTSISPIAKPSETFKDNSTEELARLISSENLGAESCASKHMQCNLDLLATVCLNAAVTPTLDETKHTSKNQKLASQSTPLQPTNRASTSVKERASILVIKRASIPVRKTTSTLTVRTPNTSISPVAKPSEIFKVSASGSGPQSTPFQTNTYNFDHTYVNHGEQTRSQADNSHPEISNQAENTLHDAGPLNSIEGSFVATTTNTDLFPPEAHSISFKNSNSPRCPRKLSSRIVTSISSGRAADSENVDAIAEGPVTYPLAEILNVGQTSANQPMKNIFEFSEYLIKRRYYMDKDFATDASDLLRDLPEITACEYKNFILKFLAEVYAQVQNSRNIIQSSTGNPEDGAIIVVQISAREALASFLRSIKSSRIADSRKFGIDESSIFADETRNLLMRLPENIAQECKGFILYFLEHAHKTLLKR